MWPHGVPGTVGGNSIATLDKVLVPGKKCASWLRNPDPPNLGQNLHEMGRHKSFWTILRSSWGFKTLRIFLEGSRPLNLNFFNHQKCQKINGNVNFLEKCRRRPPRAIDRGLDPSHHAQDASGMPRMPLGCFPDPKNPPKNPKI